MAYTAGSEHLWDAGLWPDVLFLALVAMPGVLDRFGRRLAPREWAWLCAAALDSTPAIIGGGSDPAADPARVLIFSTDNTTDPACVASTDARCVQGAIKMTGQSSLRLWGLDSGPWKGLLMWQDKRGSAPFEPINLVGQGVLNLAGTIYAPLADVKITGNGDALGTRLAVQVISYTWDIGGNGNLYMPYDPSQLYQFIQQGLVD